MTLTVTLNGESHELADGATVADAVAAAGAPPDGRGVAAAVEGEVVPRGAWASRSLATGDRVEVLQAVQGG
jgi:sulfur carrier protein